MLSRFLLMMNLGILNPTSDQVFINLRFNQQQSASVSIYNSIGQEVYTNSLFDISTSSLQVDLREQPAGVYYVTMKNKDRLITRRLVLQNK